jgi:hypothetical protein
VAQKTIIGFGGVTQSEYTIQHAQEMIPSVAPIVAENKLMEEVDSTITSNVSVEPIAEVLEKNPIVLISQQEMFDQKPDEIRESFWDSVKTSSSANSSKKDLVWLGVVVLAIAIAFGSIIYSNRAPSSAQVLSANNIKSEQIDSRAYSEWSQKYFGKVVAQGEDNDNDELTNLEEFKLGSNPTKFSSCESKLSDSESVFDLIDPKTCKKIAINDEEVINRVSQVVSIKRLNQQLAADKTAESSASSASSSSFIDELVNNTLLTKDQLATAQSKIDQQKQYATTLEKITSFMTKYRSYGPLDRDYDLPVTSDVFLRISLKYNVPLKYMMAIARLESRFGTDRYTDTGAETRPSLYKNMYSIGLDDSGNNLNYSAWSDGVEGFGRWYKNLQEKGASDCAKWKIFNPNGDYCSKVEENARIFEDYKIGE